MTKRWSSIRGGRRAGGWTWTKRYASKRARRAGRGDLRRTLVFAALASAWLTTAGGCSFYNAVVGTDAQAAKTVTVEAVLAACKGYALALHDASAARKAKALTDAQIAEVDAVRGDVNPICPGTGGGLMPAGPTDAIVTVTAGTARIIGVLPERGS